ncbi:MAG: hypothetical protein AAB524_02720 [Patescibacteria group bacterium]
MKRNYFRQNIAWTLLVFAIVTGMLGGLVYAQEVEPVQPTRTQDELTKEERQVILAQIIQELEEIELELLRLSLAVAKLALEEQAAALQQQIAAAQAAPPVLSQSIPSSESLMDKDEVVQEDTGIALDEPKGEENQEDIFAQINVEEEESTDKEQGDEEGKADRGFFAALNPFRNLGTPELAVLAILGILILFFTIRRLRGRMGKKENALQPRPVQQPQVFQSSSQATQNKIDESREELTKRVAWK